MEVGTDEEEEKADGECVLELYGNSGWPHTPLHAALWLSEEAWNDDGAPKLYDHSQAHAHAPPGGGGGRVPRARAAASLLGFSSGAFYHFAMEALPRLALLLPTLAAYPTLKLVVPKHKAGGFVGELLRLVLPAEWVVGDNQRILPYDAAGGSAPGLRLRVDTLLWADWPRVTRVARGGGGDGGGGGGGGGGSGGSGGGATHCVAPRSALRAAAALAAHGGGVIGGEDGSGGGGGPCVVWAQRGGAAKMRRLSSEDRSAPSNELLRSRSPPHPPSPSTPPHLTLTWPRI